jgi:hypothetical protein
MAAITEQFMTQMLAQYPEDVAEEIRSISDEAFGGGRLEQAMMNMMVKHYTEGEIIELARFLASPVGQSSLQKQQVIMAEMMASGQKEFLRVLLQRHPELADQIADDHDAGTGALPPAVQSGQLAAGGGHDLSPGQVAGKPDKPN